MPEIKTIDEIEDGMVTAKTIKNKFGQILIKRDTELNSKNIKILKMWKVNEIEIKTDSGELVADDEEKMRNKAIKYLDNKVSWKAENHNEELMMELAIIKVTEDLVNKD